MVIVKNKIIERYKVESLLDFIDMFNIDEWYLKNVFHDITDIQDVVNSKFFEDDETHIRQYLESRKESYEIEFIDGKFDYWIITEIQV